MAAEFVERNMAASPSDDDLVCLIDPHPFAPLKALAQRCLVVQLYLDLLPLTDLRSQLRLVLPLVNEVKNKGAIDAATDQTIVLVLRMLVVEVHKVD